MYLLLQHKEEKKMSSKFVGVSDSFIIYVHKAPQETYVCNRAEQYTAVVSQKYVMSKIVLMLLRK